MTLKIQQDQLIEWNDIYVRRQNRLFLPVVSDIDNPASIAEIATMIKNIENLGYTFSSEVVEYFKSYDLDTLVDFNKKLIPILKDLRGAHVVHTPMYPNFPRQVMEASDAELFLNAILHYFGDWIGVRIIPSYSKEKRSPLLERVKLTVLGLGSLEDFDLMFTNLMRSKTSISEQDMKDLQRYLEDRGAEIGYPEEFPFKEIMVFVARIQMADPNNDLSPLFRTATDVLRFATALSGGDISLAEETRYISFKRSQRRLLLGLLEQSGNLVENMLMHKMKWIRLMERLHPGEHKKAYPKTFAAISKLRSGEKIDSFNSKIEKYLKGGDVSSAVRMLKKRPGYFARRLDHILRLNSKNADETLDEFQSVVKEISTPVILQLIGHFKSRNIGLQYRLFMPKGSVAKTQVVENKLLEIPEKTCKQVVDMCVQALVVRFAELEPLGKVYIDPRLKYYLVPFSERSAVAGLRRLVRGSRMDIPPGSTLRMFIHWVDGVEGQQNSRIDLDLTGVLLDAQWSYLTHISYTKLRDGSAGAYHSGDLTSAPAPNGASEFIDFDIQGAINMGGRYVMMNVYSYTRQPFSSMNDAFAGWMIREAPQSGEIFEPTTIQDKFSMTTNARTSLPIIFDLVERKMIWADLGMQRPRWEHGGINIESNIGKMLLQAQSIVEMKRMTLYALLSLHAKARGTLGESLEDEPDVVFSEEAGTPFDFEKIVGEFL